MMMSIPWLCCVVVGPLVTFWALATSSANEQPAALRWWAALLAPAGILTAIAGAIALAVPGFFSG